MPAPKNLIHETTTSTGTGNLTLVATTKVRASDPTHGFGSGATPNTLDYFIAHRTASEWEIGTGHMADTDILVRDTVVLSSNGNTPVNFTPGIKDVTSDVPAAFQTRLDLPNTFTAVNTFQAGAETAVPPANGNQLANKTYVDDALALKAPLASPALTGNATSTTPPIDDDDTSIATTAYVIGQASNIAPTMNGTANAGATNRWSRSDHVHPTDTSRAAVDHTHTAAEITDLAETIDDRVDALLVEGSNITMVYDDVANTLTIGATPSSDPNAVTAAVAFGTDNRLLRSDGTARGVQASGITVDDSNNISGAVAATLGGALTLEYAAPRIFLKASAAGDVSLVGIKDNKNRWQIDLPNNASESTGDLGSNVFIWRYNDAGTTAAPVMQFYRSSGLAEFYGDISINRSTAALTVVSTGGPATARCTSASGFTALQDVNPGTGTSVGAFRGLRNGVVRWTVEMPSATDNYSLKRRTDAAATIEVLGIDRETGLMTVAGEIAAATPPSAGNRLTNKTYVDGAISTAGSGYQPADATLTALAGLSATAGILEQTGADAFSKRATGVANSDDLLTRADGDGRYAFTSHTHLTSEITDFYESVDDRVNALLTAGTLITLDYNDTANTLTVNATTDPTRAPLASPAFTGTPTAPTAATATNTTQIATTAYVKANLTSYLPLATGVPLTGNLTINKASPIFDLDKTASGQAAEMRGMTAGSLRWRFQLGDNGGETGSNAGSDYRLTRLNDTGGLLGYPLIITRATGVATMEQIVVGAPSSPVSATGNINAKAVYDDGVLLTCYVLDAALHGDIDIPFFDSVVRQPPPEPVFDETSGEVVGHKKQDPRTHHRAHAFVDRLDELDVRKFRDKWRASGFLPGFPDPEARLEEQRYPVGEWINALAEQVELLHVHVAQLAAENDALKAQIAALEAGS